MNIAPQCDRRNAVSSSKDQVARTGHSESGTRYNMTVYSTLIGEAFIRLNCGDSYCLNFPTTSAVYPGIYKLGLF
jgi:hypothetical protein